MVGRESPFPQRGSEAELQALREQIRALTQERAELTQRVQGGEGAAEEIAAAIEVFDKLAAGGHIERPATRSLRDYVELAGQQLAALNEREQSAARRISELEESHRALQEQLESGASAMAEALDRVRTLQEEFDAQVAERTAQIAERDAQIAERTAQITERDARIRELEAALTEARESPPENVGEEDAVGRLLEENRRLASQVEAMSSDLVTVQRAAREAKDDLEAVREETSARIRDELGAQLVTLQRQHEALQKQLDLATAQLSAEGKTPALPADRVAEMLTNLIDRMQDGMPGLSIQTGELKLRVGLEAAGGSAGFVIPSSDSPAELRESLQEVTLRFDHRGGLTP
jgi:chromosome segregation ATPase